MYCMNLDRSRRGRIYADVYKCVSIPDSGLLLVNCGFFRYHHHFYSLLFSEKRK